MMTMSEFYNESVKNRYLDEIENEGSRTTLSYVFIASKVTEEILEKDLYNFTDEECYLVLKNMPAKSYSSAMGNLNNVKKYISWAISTGYRENNINPLDIFDRKKLSKCIDRTTKIHYSEEELDDLIEEFDNAQDQAMVRLWFEGIQGKNNAEIKNLSYYDINWNTNELQLQDEDGSRRSLFVSDKCMRYLERAKNQTVYNYYTGDGNTKEQPLLDSNFIFRNTAHHRVKEKEISNGVIYNRIHMLQKMFNLEYFSPNSIKQSGALSMAYQLFLRDGELKKKQFYEVGERYNVSKVTDSNGDSYPNVTLMKNYITSENLKEFYDIDVEIVRGTRSKK
jgi:site-specific recombinase XerD